MNLPFELEALVLYFEEEVPLPEDVLVARGHIARGFILPCHQVLAKLARQAPGEADQARRMFGQVALRDARLAIEAVQRSLRCDADQIAIALFIFGQYQ